ncbi:MAG: SprT family zinc-dependent metalloprotease [Burkholderiales bacterium]
MNQILAQLELPFASPSPRPVVACSAVLDGQPVSYVLHRSHGRRRISLSVDERGLRIGAPLRASMREIETVLRDHARWVVRKLSEWGEKRVPGRRWVDGETLMFLGQPLQLNITTDEKSTDGVAQRESSLQISTQRVQPENIAALARAWLRTQALSDFAMRIDRFRETMAVAPADIRLSNARTRWGSCHASGRILLNWRLIQMPARLIDYVVVHELAHLREMNHSPRFWTVVAKEIPDYAARRREIRRDALRYIVD